MSASESENLEPEEGFWEQLDDDASPEAADWSGDELEEAYLRAMEVLEASDAQLPELPPAPVPVDLDAELDRERPVVATDMAAAADRISPAELNAELAQRAESAIRPQPTPSATVSPLQILESLLFVGGEPLTTRKLGNVLRGEFSAEYLEAQIDELNALYAREGRPYEIRLGEGGYRIALREQFERIRRKTYGLGPKEVKLSQDAIEVLAVVAYHQPLTAQAIEELGKPGCSPVLRQLLRRELIAVERSPERPREVAYRTTPRFLSLFGIRNLNELPRLEQVSYK